MIFLSSIYWNFYYFFVPFDQSLVSVVYDLFTYNTKSISMVYINLIDYNFNMVLFL
jgi:hypothetical protein